MKSGQVPFNTVIRTHDLTKKPKLELRDKIQEAQKRRQDESGQFVFENMPERNFNSKLKECNLINIMPVHQHKYLRQRTHLQNISPKSRKIITTKLHQYKNSE